MWENILIVLSALLVSYIALFLLSIKIKDNSIADVFWGVWFVIISILSYFLSSEWYTSQVIITLLVSVWGIRLFLNILSKKLPYDWKEDARYKRWRDSWTYFKTRSFFQVYMLQGLLMLIIATPILILNFSSWFEENITLIFLWAFIALFWLIYEVISDAQLAWFIKNKSQWEILTTWLRSYSRYPQYFGESVFWLGICVISLQVSVFAFVWWWVITFLLVFVSGVPLLEKRYAWNKKYQLYSKKTPLLIPDFTKIQFKK